LSHLQKKILIADDDVELTDTIAMRLEALGYSVTSVNEGLRVLNRAQEELPNLIILDLQMPSGQGQTILQKIRDNQKTAHIPVIVLSGLDDPQTIQEVLSHGAQHYIVKPYEVEDLIKKIKICLN